MRFIPLLLIFLFTFSCTIQKRVHRPGWHVTWNKKYRSSDKSNETLSSTFKEVDAVYESQPSEQQLTPIEIETISEAAIEPEESEPISNAASLVENEKDSEPDEIQFENKTIESSDQNSTFEDSTKNKTIDKKNIILGCFILTIAIGAALLGASIYKTPDNSIITSDSSYDIRNTIRGLFFISIGALFFIFSIISFTAIDFDKNDLKKIEREEEKEQIKQIDPLKEVKPEDPKQRMKSNIAVGIILALIVGFIVFVKKL